MIVKNEDKMESDRSDIRLFMIIFEIDIEEAQALKKNYFGAGNCEENSEIQDEDEEDLSEMSDYKLFSDFEGLWTSGSTLDEEWLGKKVEKKICGFSIWNINSTADLKSPQEEQKSLIHVRLQGSFSRPGRYCICFFLILTCSMVVVDGTQWQCEVSLKTINFTSFCPTNETDYIQRSKEKNCEDIKQNCTTTSNFKYHCVIDTTGSKFIEVCAPQRFIFGHFCTEFNKGGARVQEHFAYGCKQFKEKPCPVAYPSWKCYEYPGCYSLILKNEKKAVTSTDHQFDNTAFRKKPGEKRRLSAKIAMTLAFFLPFLLMSVTISLFVKCRKQKFSGPTKSNAEQFVGHCTTCTFELSASAIMSETKHCLEEDESSKGKYNGQTIQTITRSDSKTDLISNMKRREFDMPTSISHTI